MTRPQLSVDQYHALLRAGAFDEVDPVELLEGHLILKAPKSPEHRIALAKLQRALAPLLPAGTSMQLQEPITLSDGEPEPDATVFTGLPEDYADRHPGPAEVQWVIEVADTTLARDRGVKLRSYARAGLAIYWIIDLVNGAVEVYRRPEAQASTPAYGERRIYDAQAVVPVELGGRTVGSVAVAAILP